MTYASQTNSIPVEDVWLGSRWSHCVTRLATRTTPSRAALASRGCRPADSRPLPDRIHEMGIGTSRQVDEPCLASGGSDLPCPGFAAVRPPSPLLLARPREGVH